MKNRISILIILLSCTLSLCQAQTVYLYTPNKHQVYAFSNSEMSSTDIDNSTNSFKKAYPQATVLKNASTTYNCHSYAWNMTKGGPVCWLNQDPDLHWYWDDYSYGITTEVDAEVIFYYYGDHSAIKSSVVGMYESKWGSGPLMRHSPEYGPPSYNMQYRRYYKKIAITGPTLVCSVGEEFIINNLTANSTVVWSYSGINGGGGINITPGTGVNMHKATVSAANSTALGAVMLKATIDNVAVLEKPVTVNFPLPSGNVVNLRPNQTYQLNLPNNPEIIGYTWSWSNTSGVYYNTYYNEVSFSNQGMFTLNLYLKNKCTTSTPPIITYVFNVSSSSMSLAYPNPVSDILNIETDAQAAAPATQSIQSTAGIIKNTSAATYDIRLYDEHGKLMRQKKAKSGKVQFNVSHLPNGNYYLHIYNGVSEKPEIHQIMVKH